MKIGIQYSALLGLLLLAVVGCADKDRFPRSSDGGQHGGGGDYQKSTTEDVRVALDRALELASDTDYRKNIFAKYVISKRVSFTDEMKTSSSVPKSVLFPELRSDLKSQSSFNAIFFYDIAKSPLFAFGDPSRITRLETGTCKAPDNPHPAASVSELTPRASICFSIPQLKLIPRSALLREILGLIMHEAVHMAGLAEPDARRHQNEFLKYFATVEAEIGNVDVITQAEKVSVMSEKYLDLMESAVKLGDQTLFVVHLEKFRGLFTQRLNFILDPIRMSMAGKPARPEYYDDYARSVLAVLFETAVFNEFVPSFEKAKKEEAPKVLSIEDFKKKRVNLDWKLNIMRSNAAAYLKGKNGIACINPEYENGHKLGIFDQESFDKPMEGRPGTFNSQHNVQDTRLNNSETDLPLFTFPPRGNCR